MIKLNKVVEDIKPSAIRKYFGIAETLPNAISLGVGEPDFSTPKHICDASIEKLNEGRTQYTSNSGLLELRQELSKWLDNKYQLKYNPDEIVITCGASEAVDITLRALITPGDEILLPEPTYISYAPLITLAGGKVKFIHLKEENKFKLTKEELEEAITPNSKILFLNFPTNPTGAIMEKKDLEAIKDTIIKNDLTVISDEIYGELTYNNKAHYSIGALEGMKERTIIINGFSKAFAMTGWRLGYVCAPQNIIKGMLKIHQYIIMSAPTNAQYAGVEALRNGEEDIKRMRNAYDERRKYLVKELRSMGFDLFEPEGAFYIFPNVSKFAKDGEDFAEKLLEKEELVVVPGFGFGDQGKNHVRISYAYSMDELKEAMRRIKHFINNN